MFGMDFARHKLDLISKTNLILYRNFFIWFGPELGKRTHDEKNLGLVPII